MMKGSFTIVLLFILVSVDAQVQIDSLISSWNKLSRQYLQVNELDSACKYGNCAVEMLDQKLAAHGNTMSDFEIRYLRKDRAEALSTLVSAYGSSDKIALAMECYYSALKTFTEIANGHGIYNLHIRVARIYDLRSS